MLVRSDAEQLASIVDRIHTDELRVDVGDRYPLSEVAGEPVLRAVAALVGDADALMAARMLVAWAQGFVSMELAGAFRLGSDVEAAFENGLERVTAALAHGEAGTRHR
jgi:hypothetical protein